MDPVVLKEVFSPFEKIFNISTKISMGSTSCFESTVEDGG
jgi:hypothetical protein